MSTDETTHSLPPVIEDAPGLPPDDGDDEWAVRGPAKGIRLAVPMAALIGVLLVAAGFWGGATLQKRSGGSGSGNASLASAFAARLRGSGATGATGATGAAGAAGFGGFGGSSAAAVGTVSVVDGSTLYVLSATGSLVKVTLGPSTTITRNAKAPASGLRPGDTVIVQGSTGGNGEVTASSVSATAPGVSATGGFGGGRFGGAGSGAATGG
jgi:Domain of unknown function (DUF5666)